MNNLLDSHKFYCSMTCWDKTWHQLYNKKHFIFFLNILFLCEVVTFHFNPEKLKKIWNVDFILKGALFVLAHTHKNTKQVASPTENTFKFWCLLLFAKFLLCLFSFFTLPPSSFPLLPHLRLPSYKICFISKFFDWKLAK